MSVKNKPDNIRITSGGEFVGWKIEGTEEEITTEHVVKESIILEPIIKENKCKVTYKWKDKNNIDQEKTDEVERGKELELLNIADNIYNEEKYSVFKFKCWKNEETNEEIQKGYKIDKNIVLVPKFELDDYVIVLYNNFDENDDEDDPNNVFWAYKCKQYYTRREIVKYKTENLPSPNDNYRDDGYYFEWWYSDKKCNNARIQLDMWSAISDTLQNKILKLYANWKSGDTLRGIEANLKRDMYFYNIDTISKDDILVTAKYYNGSTKDVRNFSYEPTTIGNDINKITVTYEENGITVKGIAFINWKTAVAYIEKHGEKIYYDSLSFALGAAEDSDTIVILINTELNNYSIHKNITLKGEEESVKISTSSGIEISKNTSAVLENITIESTEKRNNTIYNYGNLTINSGKYISTYRNAIYNENNLEITGGTFSAYGAECVIGIKSGITRIRNCLLNISPENNPYGWNCGIWIISGSLDINKVTFKSERYNIWDIAKGPNVRINLNRNNYSMINVSGY